MIRALDFTQPVNDHKGHEYGFQVAKAEEFAAQLDRLASLVRSGELLPQAIVIKEDPGSRQMGDGMSAESELRAGVGVLTEAITQEADFLRELYALLVDPAGPGSMDIREMQAAILKAARGE